MSRGGDPTFTMRRRSIVLMVILGLFIPFYWLYWTCSVQNQIRRRTGRGFGGVGHFFMILFFSGIYLLYWHFVIAGRIHSAGGPRRRIIGWLYFLGVLGATVLTVVGIAMVVSAVMDVVNTAMEGDASSIFDAIIDLWNTQIAAVMMIIAGAVLRWILSLVVKILIQGAINQTPDMTPNVQHVTVQVQQR